MKRERKFRFVGDTKKYEINFEIGRIYSFKTESGEECDVNFATEYPKDWEEVTEQEGCYAIPKTKPNFKFIGDPSKYGIIKKGEIIPYGFHPSEWDKPVEFYAGMYPEDWEKVDQEPTWIFEPSNKDQLASSMTKFEKCVIDIIGNIYSNINIKTQTPTYQEISQIAINQAKETFKQLDELK